LGEPT